MYSNSKLLQELRLHIEIKELLRDLFIVLTSIVAAFWELKRSVVKALTDLQESLRFSKSSFGYKSPLYELEYKTTMTETTFWESDLFHAGITSLSILGLCYFLYLLCTRWHVFGYLIGNLLFSLFSSHSRERVVVVVERDDSALIFFVIVLWIIAAGGGWSLPG